MARNIPGNRAKDSLQKNWRIPVVLQMLLAMTFGNFNNAAYSPLAPFIKSSFLLSSTELGLITSVIFIGTVSVSLMSGLLVDRLGPYTAMKIAFGIIGTGGAVTFLATSYPVLLSGFFLIGFGYGIVTPSTNSATMSAYYPEHSTRMGIKQAGVPLGILISTAVLTTVALHFSLRASFLVLVIVAASMAIIMPREKTRLHGSDIRKGYLKDLLSAGKNKGILAVAMSVVFLSWGQQSLLTFFVLFERSKGFTTGFAEILLIILVAGSIFGRIFWSYVSDRFFKRNRVITLSTIMAIAGLLFIVLFAGGTFIPVAMALAFIIGMNAVGWNSTYVTMISEIAPRNKVGVFSGVSFVFTGFGTIIGTPLSGNIVDRVSFVPMWTILGSALMIMSVVFLFAGSRVITRMKS